jgi:hypothetical protein
VLRTGEDTCETSGHWPSMAESAVTILHDSERVPQSSRTADAARLLPSPGIPLRNQSCSDSRKSSLGEADAATTVEDVSTRTVACPESDAALHDRLEAIYSASQGGHDAAVVDLFQERSRPQRLPRTRGNTAATRVRMLAGERIPKSCTALRVQVPLAAQ